MTRLMLSDRLLTLRDVWPTETGGGEAYTNYTLPPDTARRWSTPASPAARAAIAASPTSPMPNWCRR